MGILMCFNCIYMYTCTILVHTYVHTYVHAYINMYIQLQVPVSILSGGVDLLCFSRVGFFMPTQVVSAINHAIQNSCRCEEKIAKMPGPQVPPGPFYALCPELESCGSGFDNGNITQYHEELWMLQES